MAITTPDERAEAVVENPSYLFDFMGRHLLPEAIRVRVNSEDMEVMKALFHLMHHVLLDPSASDTLRTIAGDCREAMRAAVEAHFIAQERLQYRRGFMED